MKLTFPLPLPRLFNDPGRCARVCPGLLRAWDPARVIVAQDLGPRLMVGVRTDLRPITERQCYPESMSLAADLRWRLRLFLSPCRSIQSQSDHVEGLGYRYGPLGIRLFGHRPASR